jgi:hypothetical protein
MFEIAISQFDRNKISLSLQNSQANFCGEYQKTLIDRIITTVRRVRKINRSNEIDIGRLLFVTVIVLLLIV